ncbi:hypothetical protein [uncultured Nostoc sp.]|uniref:hypothetical protein n=1 Tax=uncultured Nostoc sp. TaxID=340711 RepID=UPI0035CBDA3A
MPINSYQNREIETNWEPKKGWYYRVDSGQWWGPFDSEEKAMSATGYAYAAAEDRIDLEDWE